MQHVTDGEVVKLRVARKHITDLLKMVAYQAESDLVRLVSPHYRRAEQEGRTLIQSALASAGDIALDGDDLRVALEPLSSPHRTHALGALCRHSIRRRSQKTRLTWERMGRLARRWLPYPRIVHPYPEQRLSVTT